MSHFPSLQLLQPPVALTQSLLLKQAEPQAAGEIRVHILLAQVVQPPVALTQSLLLEQAEPQAAALFALLFS